MNPTDGQISGAEGAQPPQRSEKKAPPKQGIPPTDAAAKAAADKLKSAGQPASPAAPSDEAISEAMQGVSDTLQTGKDAGSKGPSVRQRILQFEELAQQQSPQRAIAKREPAPPPALGPRSAPPAVPERKSPPAPLLTESRSGSTSSSSSSLTSSTVSSPRSSMAGEAPPPALGAGVEAKGKTPIRPHHPPADAQTEAAAPYVPLDTHEAPARTTVLGTAETAGTETAAPPLEKQNMAFKIWRQVAKLPKPVVSFVTGLAISRSKMGSQQNAEQYPRELIRQLPPKLFATLPSPMVANLLPGEIQSLSQNQLLSLGDKATLIGAHLTPSQNWGLIRSKTEWMPASKIASNRFNTVVLGLNPKAPAHAILSTLGDTFGYVRASVEGKRDRNNMGKEIDVQTIHQKYTDSEGRIKYTQLLADARDDDGKHVLFSDDTVMTRMTLEALSKTLQKAGAPQTPEALQALLDQLRIETKKVYVQYNRDNREGLRGTGGTIAAMVKNCPKPEDRYAFNPPSGDGCGGSMRCMVFGDMFPGENNREILLKATVDNVAITHTHPVGIVGGLCTALMTAYSKENVPFYQWMDKLLNDVKPGGTAYNYALETIPGAKEHKAGFDMAWAEALNTVTSQKLLRMPPQGTHAGTYNTSSFPDTIEGRQAFARQLAKVEIQEKTKEAPPVYAPQIEVDAEGRITKNQRVEADAPNCVTWTRTHPLSSGGLGGWPGRNGDDAAMMPYDYLMLSIASFAKAKGLDITTLTPSQFRAEFSQLPEADQRQFFDEFVKRACWHEGDSDTTGTIALGIWGAFMGTAGVPAELARQVTSNVFV